MTISDIPNDDDAKSRIENLDAPIYLSDAADKSYIDSSTAKYYLGHISVASSSTLTTLSPAFTTAHIKIPSAKSESDHTGALETLFKLIDDLQTNICTLQEQVASLEYKLADTEKKIAVISEQPVANGCSDGLMSKEDKAKLDTIEYGATHNSKDLDLLDRRNHRGIQSIATIDGLQASLDSKAFVGIK